MTATAVPTVRVDAFGLTDPGLVRKTNEDHFAVVSLHKSVEVKQASLGDARVIEAIRGPEALLFVVADGVGGRPGGELASETAITALLEYIGKAAGCFNNMDVDREHEFLEQLERAVNEAHERVAPRPGSRGYGPATTLTLATLVWPRAYLVHVGDSRAFYRRKGRLRQLTRDQTLGEYMVEAGAWTEEQAAAARRSGVLASAIGGNEMLPAIGLVDLQIGDVLLLCSDGLTKHVPDERIGRILDEAPTAERACRELVDAALEGGGSDNVTVIVARMQG